jgi:hypothetical protein
MRSPEHTLSYVLSALSQYFLTVHAHRAVRTVVRKSLQAKWLRNKGT